MSRPAFISLFLGLLLAPLTVDAYENPLEIERAKRAVLYVAVRTSGGSVGHGSGFVFRSNGFRSDMQILTARHIFERGGVPEVTFPGVSQPVPALLRCANDPDAALLKVDLNLPPDLPIRTCGSCAVRQNDEVVVLGYPLPTYLGTSEVSLARRHVARVSEFKIYMDGHVAQGYSGGPVLNKEGQVVGLVSGVFLDPGRGNAAISSAVPIALALRANYGEENCPSIPERPSPIDRDKG